VPEEQASPAVTADLPLAMLVSAVFDAFVEGLHRRLPEAGFPDIRPAHCTGVFRVIDPKGTRPGELARRAGITPQGMAELVRYLESRGYVERLPDPHDRRGRIVRLTRRGTQAAAAAADAFTAIEAAWRKRLGAKSMNQLRHMLAELVKAQ
jgi:DNA-binding MarR family transcriptional regulator